MWWAVVSVVGFAAVNALVIWLARSNTARWERNHRAAQARVVRRETAVRRRQAEVLVATWRLPPDGGSARLLRALRAHLPNVRGPHVGQPRARRVGVPHVGLPHLHLPHIHLPDRVVARLRRPPDERSGHGPEDAEVPPSPG